MGIGLTPRHWAYLGLGVAATAFAAALISQYVFGLQPCKLCIWQRYPYAIGGLLGLAALAPGAPRSLLFGLAALVFLGGAGIAVFHSGVEFAWWEGLASCSAAPLDPTLSPEEFRRRLSEVALVRCDERTPFFLELTMANWNLLVSGGVGAALGLASYGAAQEARAGAAAAAPGSGRGYSSSSASQ